MARVLGYGIGNTNGLRSFAGKTPAVGGAEWFGEPVVYIPTFGLVLYRGRFA